MAPGLNWFDASVTCVVTHAPAAHDPVPPVQACPQVPQLFESDDTSVHEPAQSVCAEGQVQRPATHE